MNNTTRIYLDSNATTPILPAVLDSMLPFLSTNYGNPSSAHVLGLEARQAVEIARGRIAGLVGCESREVVFTSSATEAINTAIHSAISNAKTPGRIVTTAVEHSAVLSYCADLERRGYDIVRIGVDELGNLNWEEFQNAVQSRTLLVSVMWANNETGVLFPIDQINGICQARGILLHVDAVQTAGKWPIFPESLSVDYVSISAHKMHGPKGTGALIVRDGVPYHSLHHGGRQESGRRGGTENVAGVVGFGMAAMLASAELDRRAQVVGTLRDQLEHAVIERIPGAYINGLGANRLPNTTNIGFPEVDADTLVATLDAAGICVSAGSACLADSIVPSHVIMAMTHSYAKASEAIRFSLSHLNTSDEINRTVDALAATLLQISQAASGSA